MSLAANSEQLQWLTEALQNSALFTKLRKDLQVCLCCFSLVLWQGYYKLDKYWFEKYDFFLKLVEWKWNNLTLILWTEMHSNKAKTLISLIISFIFLFIHSSVHFFIHSFICLFIHSLIHLFIRSFTNSLIAWLIDWFIHIHTFIHRAFINSLIHSICCSIQVILRTSRRLHQGREVTLPG